MLTYAAKTDLGNQRDNNEDAFLVRAQHGLWILADGVGGLDAGEIASDIACKSIADAVINGESVEDAIQTAHQAIIKAPTTGVGQRGMASTIVVLLVHGDTYQISWVGDSRAYLWSSGDHQQAGVLQQLSKDQSLVQKLLDEGVITAEQAVDHPRKNLVLQALGQPDLKLVEVETVRGQFRQDDQLLLCSDGLSDYVSDTDIAALLNASETTEDKVGALINQALRNEGKDNITAILVDLTTQDLSSTQEVEAVSIPRPQSHSETAAKNKHNKLLLACIIPLVAAGTLAALWFFN
jgi:PPM family protein phosphatase